MVPASVFAEEPLDTDVTTETLPAGEPPGTTAETAAATEPSTETEPFIEPEPPAEPEPTPIPLETSVRCYDDCFAVLSARQENLSFRIVAANATFRDPQINACAFEVDPDIASVGFEIRLDGVSFYQDPVVRHGGNLTVTVSDIFANADPEFVQVFDISGKSWLPLAHDGVQLDGNQATVSFYAPDLNSRFAIVEGFSEAAVYSVDYGTQVGEYVSMAVNNKMSWCVYGQNPYGFGNAQNGTFALHLVHQPSADIYGKSVGYKDYVAAACLEYWKSEPIISEGQIVTAGYGGTIGGWSDLTVETRRQVVSYLLYGVRYLSDWSFDNNLGAPTLASDNPVVNMAYAQQVIIWAAIKGVDPLTAASYYGSTVSSYASTIIDYAERNHENYDYDNTLILVGEGDSRQDVALILKAVFKKAPSGDVIAVKAVKGPMQKLGGWVMELYTSYANAEQGTAPLRSAGTDGNGKATFKAVPNGTYYLREAPASRQKNDLTGWTLSKKVLTVTVNGKNVTVTGITNLSIFSYPYFIQKVSGCSQAAQQQLTGNRMYSLQGARYSVSLNGVLQETLVTDSTGLARGGKRYPAGTRLTVQEVQAPPGYKLDPTVYTLVITSGGNTLEVADEPLFDPPFSLTKVDQDTTVPQGDSSFAHAIFKWEYFDNDSWSGQPLRTWYLQTDDRGIADLRADHLAPGYHSDPLYVDDAGNPDLPIGTVTGSVPQGDGSLEGAEFELINNSKQPIVMNGQSTAPGEVLMTFRTDADGHCEFTGLPLGSYSLREAVPPEGYDRDQAWSYGFDITTEQQNIVLSPDDACHNTVIRGGFRIVKQDAALGSKTDENALLDGITFTVTNESLHPVLVNGTVYAPGEAVTTLAIAWDGTAWSAETGVILPYGTYGVTENETAPGMANDQYLVNPEKKLVEVRDSVSEILYEDQMADGKIIVHKVDPLGKPLAGARFQLLWSEDGTDWNPVTFSEAVIKGGCSAPGLENGSLVSREDGVISFTGLHSQLFYRVVELEAPDGYVLLTGPAFEGKLPVSDPVRVLTVHNSPGFTFPTTGSDSLHWILFTGFTLASTALLGAVLFTVFSKRRTVRKKAWSAWHRTSR